MTFKMSPQEKDAYALLVPVIGEELAFGVVEMRQCTVKKKLTGTAAKILIKEYLKTGNPQAASEMHIVRAWQGFYADWYFKEMQKQARNAPRGSNDVDMANFTGEFLSYAHDRLSH